MKIFNDWLKVLIALIILLYALSIYVALACTDKEIKNAICWATCRSDQFDGGHYREKSRECVCEMNRKYKDAQRNPQPIPIHPDTAAYQ